MNFSIIGTGRMGVRHIQAANQLGLDIVGAVDQNEATLHKVQQEYNLPDDLVFSSDEKMYKTVIPDCLIIATTADSHCALTCKAARKGVKYILVEKPLAVSLDECSKMIETCKKYGTVLSVNHQMRFLDQYTQPKSILNSVQYGGVKSMTVVAGNFGMSMNGTHYIEAFRYMTDETPVEVTAWFDDEYVPNPRGDRFKDKSGALRVTTESGKRFYLDIGSDQGHGIEVIYAARNGHVNVSELYGEIVCTVREEVHRDLPTTRYGMPAVRERMNIEPVEVIESTSKVLNALLTDKNRVTAEQGMMAVKVLTAAYQSAENGNRPVRLDSQLDSLRIFPWA